MKRKLLIFLSIIIVIIVALFSCISYFSSAIFGESVEKACNNKIVNSIRFSDETTVIVQDNMCDSGLVVYGEYKVILQYHDHGRVVEAALLEANNMASNSHAPEVKMLGPSELLIAAEKKLVVVRGAAEAAGIRVTYELR